MTARLVWGGGIRRLSFTLADSDSSVKMLFSLPPFSIQSQPPAPRPPNSLEAAFL